MGQAGAGRGTEPRGDHGPPDGTPDAPGPADRPGGQGPFRHLRLRSRPGTAALPESVRIESPPETFPQGAELAVVRREVRTVGPEARRRILRVRALLYAAPWVLLLVGLVYDFTTPEEFIALPVFVAAPVIAAPFYAPRPVMVVAVIALAAIALHYLQWGGFGVRGVTALLTGFLVALVAMLTNRVVIRGNVLLASARRIAAAAQRAVLPEPRRHLAGLDVAARYEAAQAGAFIGGDFYAVQDTPHGVRLLVGDVRGKGMGAVAAVSVVIGAFREAAEQETALEGVAQRLDHALVREGVLRPETEDFEEFATAVLAELPHGRDTVRIVNRGHPPPLLLYPGGRVEEAAGAGTALPLGMTDLGTWPDRAREIRFPSGVTLLLFTDGLTEARDRYGVFYEPVGRLRGQTFADPGALLDFLSGEVRRHTADAATDDLAMLAVRRP